MARLIAVTGATGNQGGSVAKLLLKFPDEYTVRALTRDPSSHNAQELSRLGAAVIEADMTVPASLPSALKGCWGVFGVTNFYDGKIKNDPDSEEQQGKNLVKAAKEEGVQCFIWSTLPSSNEMSGGRFVSKIYEGKYHVDDYMRELGLPGMFVRTGTFYENWILRKHINYNKETDTVEFIHPILKPDTKLCYLYVEKDLAAVAKAIFEQWDTKEEQLNHTYMLVSNARVTPNDAIAAIKKVTGKAATYTVLPTTGWPDRDTMFHLYNEIGSYPGHVVPDPKVLELGVKLHNVEDYVREKLAPHLGLL